MSNLGKHVSVETERSGEEAGDTQQDTYMTS